MFICRRIGKFARFWELYVHTYYFQIQRVNKLFEIMKKYQIVNNIFGWLTFLIAAVTYCLTVEPTASFWDCPEFILSGNKLEVGHPPGAPFFMLTANVFSSFVSPDKVALMVNIMSAILSAAGIMFLFWSITHLVRKLVVTNTDRITTSQIITIIGSGLVGALAYTWSDTYWFSAVEGEVYGYSSLFTAVVFWLILKWEENVKSPGSDRWLILIAYLVGLSIGVHLLNLLCIPAIVLVIYFKKRPKATVKGSLIALIISAILVAIVLYGIVPGVVKVGGWFELLFVNTLGLPFNSGLITYMILLLGALIWGIYESEKGKNRLYLAIASVMSIGLLGIPFYGYGFASILMGLLVLVALCAAILIKKKQGYLINLRMMNTMLLSMLMIVIGYSSYALIVVRSSANTPMDQNSPEDIFTLGEYLGREQYGTRPLFYGQAYNSEPIYTPYTNELGMEAWTAMQTEGAPKYAPKEKATANEKDRYEIVDEGGDIVYAHNMFFPRMYDPQYAAYGPYKVNLYEKWVGERIKGTPTRYKSNDPNRHVQNRVVNMPTQIENIRFFFNYQLNHMYWRYFMWNFVGRQNDLQSHGELDKGNWITGISFIDNLLLGNQDTLPNVIKENKGRNVFYALPLILGIIGLLWQASKGRKGVHQFWVVFFLFFMTGIAIVLYLNQTPMQPRERDYAYAGSFYAFAIWIGMGVAGITEWFKKKNVAINSIVSATCLLVPIQMVSQTWDDHDRSGRYACRDFGQNYLNSMPEDGNPVIFTCGDNDTFPLWYNQEVEGVRTDARVCNLSYLQTDWYIDQMRRPAYDSPSIPISWRRIDYAGNNNGDIYIVPEMKKNILEVYRKYPHRAKELYGDNPFEIKNIMKNWVLTENREYHFIPTDTLYIKIDKEAVERSGMIIPEEYKDSIPEYMAIPLSGKERLLRSDLMLLEMIAQTNWERPLYMSMTVGDRNYLSTLKDFFVQEGLAYRITPFNWRLLGYSNKNNIVADTERLYDNYINRFKFGGMKENPDYYVDETIMRMIYTHRRLAVTLATQLLIEGKESKALEVLNHTEQELPSSILPHSFMGGSIEMAALYKALGDKEKAIEISEQTAKESFEYLKWYNSLDKRRFRAVGDNAEMYFQIMKEVIENLNGGDKEYEELANRYKQEFIEQLNIYNAHSSQIR